MVIKNFLLGAHFYFLSLSTFRSLYFCFSKEFTFLIRQQTFKPFEALITYKGDILRPDALDSCLYSYANTVYCQVKLTFVFND